MYVLFEQVMKTCEKLRELGFHSIRMIEVRQRPFDGRLGHSKHSTNYPTRVNICY